VIQTAPFTLDNDHNEVIVTAAAPNSFLPEWMNIYRTIAGGAITDVHYLVKQVAVTTQAAGAQAFVTDINDFIAGGHNVYMGEMTPQVLIFKQLAPMMKMDLAVLEPSIRWLQLIYGTMQLYAPKKWIRIKNVGEATI